MSILETLHENKILRDIDLYFAKALSASFNASGAELLLALVFAATKDGHTCLNTANLPDMPDKYLAEAAKALSPENIAEAVSKGLICDAPAMNAPLIRQGANIYLKSFYTDESELARFIEKRARTAFPRTDKLTALLDEYFKDKGMQKAAALNAALNSLTVITGGPGTGKTSTVFSLLAVLCGLSEAPLRIAVCAPTGKAASRLTETISAKREEYKDKDFVKHIPEKAVTIHRLLGLSGGAGRPRYNSGNKLPYDIIIADEASMVDVRLMALLSAAIDDECRLILLGDKDQLASVQPGAVMGDICALAPVNAFTKERADILAPEAGKKLSVSPSPYADMTVMLDKSYRYDSAEGIGRLADACTRGDADAALDVLMHDGSGRVNFIEFGGDFEKTVGGFIHDHFQNCMRHENPADALGTFAKFRILTPHRKLAGGTDHINAIALKTLFRAGLYDNTKRFFHGMPFMITENDYSQNLFNGETGLIIGQNACLPADKGQVRTLNPLRLPAHVHAFSMTVHKSQGSEFDYAVFVLPPSDSPILTRELFYTAVTRAKGRLTVISAPEAVKACLSETTLRTSGLSSFNNPLL